METKIKGLNRDPPDISLLTQHNTNEDGLPGTYLKDFRICVTCKRWCQAINNLGTLQCKFHPMHLNVDCPGRHPKGTYECCGISPDPQSPYFSSKFKNGCTAKDCDPISIMPYPRKIQERDFPSLLHSRLQEDLNIIDRNVNKKWKDILPLLMHKGIRINADKNTFYLSRIDEETCKDRMVHKYYKNEKLTKLIRFRVRNGKEDLQLKEVVMEKNNTLLDLKEKHLNGRYSNQHNKGRVVFYEEEDGNYTGSFTGETLIDHLDEEKIYIVEV